MLVFCTCVRMDPCVILVPKKEEGVGIELRAEAPWLVVENLEGGPGIGVLGGARVRVSGLPTSSIDVYLPPLCS